ncbi:RDD family protein [Kitasatospora sp. NPDC048545]|uniref:RDD family protein n=1 Tax=Kitasatospora sp. NPDC048545 TaxID=3157208 RepID=UPI0034108FD1
MTDRPFAGGGDPAVAPQPGYYPDPSIPGFVRYWGGSAWVPGTSRPAPAAGEVLEPPRYATRRAAPGGPPSRAVPPPAVPGGGLPEGQVPAGVVPSAVVSGAVVPSAVVSGALAQTPVAAAAPVQVPPSGAVPTAGTAPEREAPAGGGDTGPVYFDQTTGGASFVIGPRVAEVIGGPVFRTVGPAVGAAAEAGNAVGAGAFAGSGASVLPEMGAGIPVSAGAPVGGVDGPTAGAVSEPAEAVPGALPGDSGWQAHPREQRGLMETGDPQRWVSWGVLPGAPEVDEERADEERAPVAGEPTTGAAAPAVAVAVREALGTSVEASGAVPVVATPAVVVPVVEEAEEQGAGEPAPPGQDRGVPAASGAAGATGAPAASGTSVRPVASGTSVRPVASAASARTTPMPAVRPARPARQSAARRRSAAPAAVPAGLGRRLAARTVDTAVLLVVAVAAGIPLGRSVSDHLQEKLDQAKMASALTRRQVQVWLVDDVVLGKIAVLIGILLFASLLYEVLPTARTGQTFGKRLTRIRVVDAAAPARTRLSLGRSLLRWIVRQTGTVLLLGLVWPVFDRPARRGWQDRAARTRVVRA